MAKKSTKKNEEAPAFEESLAQLDGILQRLESGVGTLSDSLADYEQGVRLLRNCHRQLEAAERRIELLAGVDAEGNPVTSSFSDEGSNEPLDEKMQRRGKRRSHSTAEDDDSEVDQPGTLF